jgi:hypothetical protein
MQEPASFAVAATWGEYLQALYVSERPRRIFAIVGGAVLVLATALVAAEVMLAATSGRLRLLTFPFVLGAYASLLAARLRLEYARSLVSGTSTTVVASDQGLRLVSPRSEVTIPWSDFVRWIETPTFVVVLRPKKSLIVFPKRTSVPESQFNRARELLAQRIGPAG